MKHFAAIKINEAVGNGFLKASKIRYMVHNK